MVEVTVEVVVVVVVVGGNGSNLGKTGSLPPGPAKYLELTSNSES